MASRVNIVESLMFEASRQIGPAAAGAGDVGVGFASYPGLDIPKIWLQIWRGKATLLWTTALSLVIAVLIVVVAPHRYTADTQILIDPTDLHAVGSELVPAAQVSDAAVLQVESQVRVLTSDSVLRRVIGAEGLDREPNFAGPPSLARELMAAFGLGDAVPTPTTDPTLAALNALRRILKVRRDDRTYVVDVSVTAGDPEKAARLANAVTQAYLAEQTEVRSDAARQVSQSLSARLNELKTRVREAEDRVVEFKARNNIVGLGTGGQLVSEQQLSDLNNQLSAAQARTAQTRARYEEVQRVQQSKGDIGAFPEAIQSQTITALRSQYAEVMRREAEQMTSLGARHPAVIDIEAQADRLRHMIEEEVNRIALSAHSEYDSARANEDTLSRNLETLKHNSIATNEAMVTLRELERDVQANRAVYEAFLVRARETGEQERLDTKNIRIISRADPPLRRSSPPPTTIMAAGALLVGVTAGIGIILIRGGDGGSVESGRGGGGRGESAPLRPLDTAKRKIKPKKSAAPQPAEQVATDVPILAVLPDVDPEFGVTAATTRRSAYAQAIDRVLAAVEDNHVKRAAPSILVIAAGDEEETATVALSLAAMAATTRQVLLIDADLERRTLAAVDADHSEAGLVDVAVGRRPLAEAVVCDDDTNINLLPFVSPHSRRDRDIKDDDIRSAFAQTKRFDMVIVAAMECERDPSGRFFAGLVDHIVLVVRAQGSRDGIIQRLTSGFGLDARKIRGAVVTGDGAA
jgi:polysaccharide biosynthesis transport protein